MAASVTSAMVQLVGAFASLAVPPVLYHGTCSKAASNILVHGIRYQDGTRQSMASRGGNYLTTSLAMAACFARSRAYRTGGDPVVLAIHASGLRADELGFDLNMSGWYWGEALVYQGDIAPQLLSRVDEDIEAYPLAPMLLDEPVPGTRPIAIDLTWDKASLYL